MRLAPTFFLALLFAVLSSAQKFEVASVRLAAPRVSTETGPIGGRTGGPGTDSPERIVWRATVLGPLIRQAYGVKNPQIIAPAWVMASEGFDTRFDINATLPAGATGQQLDGMVRNLLEERFGLKFHREMRELPAYTLTLAKGGAKVKAFDGDGEVRSMLMTAPLPGGGTKMIARRVPLSSMITMLEFSAFRDAVVVDRTGIVGDFDFEVSYADLAVGAPDSGLPSLMTAFEPDLGLKIEKGKAQVEVLVIDSVNKVPTEN